MKILSSNSFSNMVRSSFTQWKLPAIDADDMSTTSLQSTVTVDGLPTKEKGSASRRKVHFDERCNKYYDNTKVCKEDCQDLWCSRTELKRFKAMTVSTARAVGRSEQAHIFTSFSYKHVLLAAYDACCQTLSERSSSPLTETERSHMQVMTQVSLDRIGLENLCIEEIRRDKQARRMHVVDAVVELQDRLPVDLEGREERIRELSQSISRAPRLFARVLAEAQAQADTEA
eukprot:scaffold1123_cov168-Amphora_coffeaeformis.AAC.2